MLRHLFIKNFATISDAEIDLREGLNIITGETGAGKSIVVQAVSLALGARADSSFVRNGEDKAIIQLVAEDEDGEGNVREYIITREIARNGKNLCKIDGEIVTLTEVSTLAGKLADIHGQYDNRLILNPDEHINVLDTYGHTEIFPLMAEFSRAYEEYKSSRQKLNRLITDERENLKRMDFFKFEMNEIDNANLKLDEDKELLSRIAFLQNSEKIFQGLEESYRLLDDSDGKNIGVLSSIGQAKHVLENIASCSDNLGELSDLLGDAYYIVQDVLSKMSNLIDAQDYTPQELDSLITRLDTIENLKKKYGSEIASILSYRKSIAEKVFAAENFEEMKNTLEKSAQEKLSVLKDKTVLLSKCRLKVAEKLSRSVENELYDLNFKDARFQIAVSPASTIGAKGGDDVETLISANKGEAMKPLAKVASGGEISRIMLALKNVTGGTDNIPTLIFDEIDSGISGITASVVGRKLNEIAKNHQVICITHLPQIAACADANYRIYKETDDTSTYTHIEMLDGNSSVDEIARLLGGETVTDLTKANALELIKNAKK